MAEEKEEDVRQRRPEERQSSLKTSPYKPDSEIANFLIRTLVSVTIMLYYG